MAERFFADLRAAGWRVAGTQTFRDHHPFTGADLAAIAQAARAASARLVVTTEKDGVRLEGLPLGDLPVAIVPLEVTLEPPAFLDWLLGRISSKRAGTRLQAAGSGLQASGFRSE